MVQQHATSFSLGLLCILGQRYTRKRGSMNRGKACQENPASQILYVKVCALQHSKHLYVWLTSSAVAGTLGSALHGQQKHFRGIRYQFFDCQHLCVMAASHRLLCILQASCTGTAEVCNRAISLAQPQCTSLPVLTVAHSALLHATDIWQW